MKKKSLILPTGSQLKIVKENLYCPASDGQKTLSKLSKQFTSIGFCGTGGDEKLFRLIDRKSCNKESKKKVDVYELFHKNNLPETTLYVIFYNLITSLAGGDILKLSLTADQIEYLVLKYSHVVNDVSCGNAFFFLKNISGIFPLAVTIKPGGYGKEFGITIHNIGDTAIYSSGRQRFFMPLVD